jgi:hypothetical protein
MKHHTYKIPISYPAMLAANFDSLSAGFARSGSELRPSAFTSCDQAGHVARDGVGVRGKVQISIHPNEADDGGMIVVQGERTRETLRDTALAVLAHASDRANTLPTI